jgi:hypothetical protein
MVVTQGYQPWPVIACDEVKEKREAAGTRHVHGSYARLSAVAGRCLRRRVDARRPVEQATCQRKAMLRRGRLRVYCLSVARQGSGASNGEKHIDLDDTDDASTLGTFVR